MNAAAELREGVFPGVSRADYEAIDAARYSILKEIRRSEAHAYTAMTTPKESTPAQEFGDAFHVATLEWPRFVEEYAVAPKCDRRTKAGKAQWAEFTEQNAGKTIVKAEVFDACKAMQKAAMAHPVLGKLLAGAGANEVAILWSDPETGVYCKARADRITGYRGHTVVLDLKKTRDASYFRFRSDVVRYGYHMQGAHYLGGLETINPRPRRFLVGAVEDEPPYGVAVYELDADSLRDGAILIADSLARYRNCKESGVWPGYSEEIETLRLPAWALKDREEGYE